MKIFFQISAIIFLFFSDSISQCLTVDTCWSRLYNGTLNGADHLYDMKVSQITGNIYVTGVSPGAGGVNNDYITIKYNSDGVELWTARYNGTANGTDIAYAIAIDDSDNVYITGESQGSGGVGYNFVTIKYNTSGVQQWIQTYDGTASNNDNAYSIFVDSFHNVYVTGKGSETGGGTDYVTVKYSSGGAQYGTALKYHGPASANVASKVLLDNSGNIYITGYSTGTGGAGHDYVTIKYNPAGVVQWTSRYNGPGNNDDEPSAIGVDNSGNVYVTGRAQDTGSLGLNYATVKYNSSGVQQWVKLYDGGIGNTDEANAIYVDSIGNVYVTGNSRNSTNGADYLTIKYNTGGSEQWTSRYDGPAHSTDIARSIVKGSDGKIYVGGGSNAGGTVDDFVIIEYNPLNGNECYVSRKLSVGNDNINAMAFDYNRDLLYACGETASGGGSSDCMTARYCIIGFVTTVCNFNAIIEGIYDPSSDQMVMSDTIRFYLRNAASPYSLADSATGILDSITFSESFTLPYLQSRYYYIVLKHRNSIETWSRADGEAIICGNTMNYDFTDAGSKAYGNNLKNVDSSPSKFALYSGDVDEDGTIDASDIILIYNDALILQDGYIQTDLNGDYFADVSDLLIAYNNAINVVTVITP